VRNRANLGENCVAFSLINKNLCSDNVYYVNQKKKGEKMQYLKYQLYQEKRNKCELKVSDWQVTLSLKKGTLSFDKEDTIGCF
jgi:hypothetical protein